MDKAESKNKALLSRDALRWLRDAAKGKKRYIAVLLAVQAMISLLSVGYSLLFRDLIDRAVEQHRPGFSLALVGLVGLALVRIGLRAVNHWLDEYARSEIENSLKRRLFGTLLGRDYAAVTAVHTGEWMNRLTSDTVVVANGLTQILPNVGGMLVKLVGAFVVILILQPLFGVLLVSAGLLLVGVTRLFRPRLKKLHNEIQESDGSLRVVLQERLENLLIIRTFSQHGRSLELADEKMADHKDARMKRSNIANICAVGFNTAMQAMYLTGAAFCAGGILTGSLSYGTMTAVLQLISLLQSPFSGLSGYFTQWYGMLASAERLMEAENLPGDGTENARPQQESLDFYHQEFTAIRVEDLCFSYVSPEEADRAVTIRDVDLEVKKGEFVGIVGHSGCGKSTLMKLLMRLYTPDSGSLRLCGSSDDRELTAGDRSLFAYVPQGNQLMSGTIREIITFYDQEKMQREAELWQALKVACAADFVAQLPQGLDTPLGEHGCGLSEGQIQRLAIARAIFSQRPILLLDEATSSLDEATEASLIRNLRTMTDRTVLLITHRPQACGICDRIVRLDRG